MPMSYYELFFRLTFCLLVLCEMAGSSRPDGYWSRLTTANNNTRDCGTYPAEVETKQTEYTRLHEGNILSTVRNEPVDVKTQPTDKGISGRAIIPVWRGKRLDRGSASIS